MGTQVFSGPFETAKCANACNAVGCNFFNSYAVSKNGGSQRQCCDTYSQPQIADLATKSGGLNGVDNYSISYSFACGWVGGKRSKG